MFDHRSKDYGNALLQIHHTLALQDGVNLVVSRWQSNGQLHHALHHEDKTRRWDIVVVKRFRRQIQRLAVVIEGEINTPQTGDFLRYYAITTTDTFSSMDAISLKEESTSKSNLTWRLL